MNQDQIKECQRLLGSSLQDIESALHGVGTQEEADQKVEALKAQVRKQFRIHSKELHPDVTDDPEKVALFKRLALVMEDFENLKVSLQRKPPPPPVRVVRVQVVRVQTYNTTSATNSSCYTETGFPPGGSWPGFP